MAQEKDPNNFVNKCSKQNLDFLKIFSMSLFFNKLMIMLYWERCVKSHYSVINAKIGYDVFVEKGINVHNCYD